MRKILLASRVSGVKDELNRRLEAAGRAAVVFRADTTKEAQIYLEAQAYDLAIIDIHTPAAVDVPVDANATSGLELVQWMRQYGIDTDCILMRPRTLRATPELDNKIASLPRCTTVQQGMRLYDDLVETIQAYPSDQPVQGCEAVEITLVLCGLQSGSCENRYSVSINGSGSPKKGPLELKWLDMKDLTEITQAIPIMEQSKQGSWKGHFRMVGRMLRKALMANPDFCDDVDAALRQIGHPGQCKYTRLRFVIPHEWHAIALEAIIDLNTLINDEEDDSDLWMLKAPVYRVLTGGDITRPKVGPLFDNTKKGPLRCLLIDANIDWDRKIKTEEPDPRHDGEKLTLGHLEFVSEECDELQSEMKRLGIAQPVLLRREQGEQGFLTRVQEQLSQDWDLVHYAGHSYYDEQRRRACVFFQVDNQRVEAVTSTRLVNQLGSARLVFLSSCESASEGFVFKLAEAGVPAIVGFRWQIEDNLAAEFAESFYSHLFDRKSVEEAFFLARVQLHNHKGYAERKAWASPVLIEQNFQE